MDSERRLVDYLISPPLIRTNGSPKHKRPAGHGVYFYRGWLRDLPTDSLMSVWKIGHTQDIERRLSGLRIEAIELGLSGYDDWPVFMICGMTKSEGLALECDIHESLTRGYAPLSRHESYGPKHWNEVGFRLPTTKEWFTISNNLAALTAVLYGHKTQKKIRKFNPITTVIDGGTVKFFDEDCLLDE